MSPLRLVKSVRSLQRLQHIISVLSQHGFGHIVDRMNLRRFSPLRRWRRPAGPDGPPESMNIGRRLAAVCNELGPTFIKLGQMATTRPDLFPADVLEDLKSLQDQVQPFDSDLAHKVIKDELGGPVEEFFRSLEDRPLASGSIGQVYRGVARDGSDIMVKVQRPGVDRTIRLDLFLIRVLAEAMENYLPELRIYKPIMLVDELEQALIRELDFTHEASSTEQLGRALADQEHVRVPAAFWELSTARVLTLEAIPGKSITHVLDGAAGPYDRKALAARLADLYVKQFFEIGTFHADPHPGNILVTPPADVGLIDFGQTGTLSDELAGQLVAMVAALVYRQTDFVVDILTDLHALGPETDGQQLARDLRVLVNKYYGLPLGRVDLVTALHEATAMMRQHDVYMPRDLVLVLKTLSSVFGIVMQLDPDFDAVGLLRKRLRKLIRDRFSPSRIALSMGVAGWHGLSLLRDTPQQFRRALQHFAKGQWQLNVRHERLDRLINELDRSSNRLSFSIVIAAIVVGSSMVVTADTPMNLFGLPLQWFGIVGYLFAFVLGAGLVWAIFRSGRLS